MIDEDVIVENNIWIEQNATILQRIKIGKGLFVQAGSVAISDIGLYSTVGKYLVKFF